MPLNVTVHNQPVARRAAQPTVPPGDNLAAQVVTLGTQSTAIAGPCRLCLIADEGERIAITKTVGYAAPSASGVKLVANVERWYDLPAGNWYINCVAG